MKGQVHGGRWDGLNIDRVVDMTHVAVTVIAYRSSDVDVQSDYPPGETARILRDIAASLERRDAEGTL
ncbi:hypothetical protein FAM15407_001482 [Propionibacterium freudenreichii]|uniref:DUF7433 family protein n=1 Tax=Propionibacterium freudenreichii TaxID=1744 RepID=UPI00243465A8|nr:hypothetical protein [Propionibacterium freudenreichii]MDK9657904.1 hypothetical protein [Propionibacterium freudenreichii]WFF31057.1 hypothetical protein FAM19024_000245 [Propionibacterium freudenreichii]